MSGNPCTKYLETYAEIESRHPQLANIPPFDAILVIPAYREPPDFIQRICRQSFSGIQKLLLVLVSNHPTKLPDQALGLALQSHENLVRALPPPLWQSEDLSFHPGSKLDVLLVSKIDEHALDTKQSTGLARKIGADIALSLLQKRLCKFHWIFNTDADAHLPAEYFSSAMTADKGTAGILFPFKHVGQRGKVLDATRMYEKRLHHYVNGLRSAGSPYAFHTLGSTLVVNPEGYAKVRGFPRRNAGEDFYLINKLAKVGRIVSLEKPRIELNSRCSDRIPFGTGPAVKALADSDSASKEEIFYHPKVFELLRIFICRYESETAKNGKLDMPVALNYAAIHIGIDRFFEHAESQNLAGEDYRRHFHLWFDGFRTLKFLHYLRDNYCPNLSCEDLDKTEE